MEPFIPPPYIGTYGVRLDKKNIFSGFRMVEVSISLKCLLLILLFGGTNAIQ